ncbi:hypothetical protein F4823DRAFT_562309 [Ustulina deusta]|nr:hypothetical protein F4823DRAFT_562309 [Ustulina deusta]
MVEHASDSSSPKEDQPEGEIKIPKFNPIRYIYDSGNPLWTREQLEDLQAQLNANPERFTVRRLDNTTVEVKNVAYGEDASHWRTEVEFLGWRHLVHPMTLGNLDFQFLPYIIHQRDTRLEKFRYLLPSQDEDELHERFKIQKTVWAQCEARYLIENLLSKYELPPTINKMVCLGLGNDLTSTLELSSRHSAALTLREFLEKKLGHTVRLLAQDPEYTSDTKHVLEKEGFEIMGTNGIDGFLEVDENSLVLAICARIRASTRVKEILAELARPAVIINRNFFQQGLFRDSIDLPTVKKHLVGSAGLRSLFAALQDIDPDTPRIAAMFKEYYDAGCWVPDVQSAIRETAPWWGTYTKVWVRKNGSKLLKAESPDESPGASLKE